MTVPARPYSYTTFAAARQQLANRLYDPAKTFWPDAELAAYLTEALRTWQALTSFWRDDFTFSLQQNVTFYDLTDPVAMPNTLRPLTVTDVDLYLVMRAHLLEPPSGITSLQFAPDDFISTVARRRDEVLSVTGCTSTRRLVPAVAGRIALPDTVIDVRRVAYLPTQTGGTPYGLGLYGTSTPPTPGGAQIAADNFNRPNELPLALPWSTIASDGMQLFNSTICNQTTFSYGIAVYKANVWPSDQSVQATIKQFDPGSGYLGIGLRGFGATFPVANTYYYYLDGSPGFGGAGRLTPCHIGRLVNGVFVHLLGMGYRMISLGDVLFAQVVGNTISAFLNGVMLGSYTDPTPLTAGSPGLFIQTAGPADVTRLALGDFHGSLVLPSDVPVGFPSGPYGGELRTSVNASVLWPADAWDQQAFNRLYTLQPAGVPPRTPSVYLLSTEPPIEFDVDVPPSFAGSYELLTVEAGPALVAGSPSLLSIPDDWTHVIKWGALADLLSRESNSKDAARASYCENRYRLGLKLLSSASALLGLRIANIPLQVDSLTAGDQYASRWEMDTPGAPRTAYHAGLNMLAIAPVSDVGPYSLTATVVENAPIPVLDNDFLQVARDDLDVIIDYAQHLAAFKMGGLEFTATLPLLERFFKAASVYGLKLAELGEYTSVLYGQSQRDADMHPRMAPVVETA